MLSIWEKIEIGYEMFLTGGQYAALFFVSLLYLVLNKNEKKSEFVRLMLISTALIFCPISASILVLYRTDFYSYESFILTLPIYITIAYVAVQLVVSFGPITSWKKRGYIVALIVCIFLSGTVQFTLPAIDSGQNDVTEVLESISRVELEQPIYLWGPNEIVEQARGYDASVMLLYGRDMWQLALGAYSYEEYSKAQVQLYEWMNINWYDAYVYGWDDEVDTLAVFKLAEEEGVNVIILTIEQMETQKVLEQVLKLEQLGYDLYYENKSYVVYLYRI